MRTEKKMLEGYNSLRKLFVNDGLGTPLTGSKFDNVSAHLYQLPFTEYVTDCFSVLKAINQSGSKRFVLLK